MGNLKGSGDMAKVVRAFTWDGWRLVLPRGEKKYRPIQETFRVEVTAVGPCISTKGHDTALNRLQEKVGTWLLVNWRNALLLPAKNHALQQAALRDAPFLAHCVVQSDTQPTGLADYLLCQVCEPLLRDHGLLVSAVRLRRGCEPYVAAELSAGLVELYVADFVREGVTRYSAKALHNDVLTGMRARQGAHDDRRANAAASPQ